MTLLLGIWWFTVGLATLSLLAMTSLILARIRKNTRQVRDDRRGAELKTLIWETLKNPERMLEVKNKLQLSDRRLLSQLFMQLLETIRGEYADRFVSLMRILGLLEECLERMRHRSWEVRAEACSVLAAFKDPTVQLALYRALEDVRMEVRVAAARSLVRLRAVRAVTDLLDFLVVEGETPSLAVVDLFRNLGQGAVPELLALLESDSGISAKTICIDALGYSRDLRAVPALLPFYDHPEQTVRVATLQSLTMLKDRRALPAVMMAMTDLDWEVRSQAADCAGHIGAVEALPLLARMLEDRQWWVRYQAAEALHRLGLRGISVLQEVATKPNPLAAEMAWGVLREKGLAA